MSSAAFMKRAIALAEKGKGKTSPNPIVGAVVVKNNKIIAEGFHEQAGKDHAEIVALKKLKPKQIAGAMLYVTLEPCCHTDKRTPPCAQRIVKSGIKKVVIGTRDPNPRVHSQGIRFLMKGGLKVVTGVLEKECRDLNPAFNKWITTGLPYVTLKVAMTLDGKIAGPSTSSGRAVQKKWITNAKSRRHVHKIRSEVDAILIGAGTLRQDNPLLTVRLPGKRIKKQPMAVVLAGKKPIPRRFKLFKVKGRKVLVVKSKKGGNLKPLLKKLGKMGVTHLMIEGGGEIYASFVRQKLVDRFMIFIAPKIFGENAKSWLRTKLKFKRSVKTLFGSDLLVDGHVIGK